MAITPPITDLNFIYPVQTYLNKVEEKMHSQAQGFNPVLEEALKHLLSAGGKRIRPVVALLTGGMIGADKERLVTLASAIELLHTATLVHDDLIDGALMRRGIFTLNSRWSPATTVLTGDFVFARAAQLAAETNSVEVMRIFAEALSTIVNGEITQLLSSRGLTSRADYEKRIYAKTASLFEVSASGPALLGMSEPPIVERLGFFGRQIGMAFQIVDDILDYTSEQETMGKPVANDLQQGLITLPALLFLEVYPHNADIHSIIDTGNAESPVIERLLTAIRQSGSIERAMDEARGYVEQAVLALDEFEDSIEKRALIELAYYIVNRQM